MTYAQMCDANAIGLKKYTARTADKHTADDMFTPHFCFKVMGINYEKNLCLINGEWQSLSKTIENVYKQQICITNPQIFKAWAGFDNKNAFYINSYLNKATNHTLFATENMYSKNGAKAIVQSYMDEHPGDTKRPHCDILSEYVQMDYVDLCVNMSTEPVGDVIILMRVKTWNAVRWGYKLVNTHNWRDILGCYGCDDFAYYVDGYNLHFVGYHHDSDTTPNIGVLREIKQGVQMTDVVAQRLLQKCETGEQSSLLSRYTTSLKPYFKNVYGI